MSEEQTRGRPDWSFLTGSQSGQASLDAAGSCFQTSPRRSRTADDRLPTLRQGGPCSDPAKRGLGGQAGCPATQAVAGGTPWGLPPKSVWALGEGPLLIQRAKP